MSGKKCITCPSHCTECSYNICSQCESHYEIINGGQCVVEVVDQVVDSFVKVVEKDDNKTIKILAYVLVPLM